MWLEPLRTGLEASSGLRADPDVLLGHRLNRRATGQLSRGPACRVRSGSVPHLATTIGNRAPRPPGGLPHRGRRSRLVRDGRGLGLQRQRVVHTSCSVARFTEIGHGAFLAPGSTVTRDVQDRCVDDGGPAVVDTLDDVQVRVWPVDGSASRHGLAQGAP